MKNKTVIRRPNEKGTFTTVHHSILFDTRLSALELRILICILSDSDNFNLTQKLLTNRLGITKKTLQKAFKRLEECGYIKRTELKKGHYYTISEYGNLSKKEESVPENVLDIPTDEIEIPQPIIQETVEPTEIVSTIKIEDYINIIGDLTSHATEEQTTIILTYLIDAISDGRITKPEQMSEDNLMLIINKIAPAPKLSHKGMELIHQVCEERAGGRGITIGNKKEITQKVVKFFTENTTIEPTERAIRSKIMMYKSKYISHGHLDQRYQN